MADARRERWLLLWWLIATLSLSSVRELPALGASGLIAVVALHRGSLRNFRRTLRAVAPIGLGLTLFSSVAVRLASGAFPPWEPFAALLARAAVLAFLTFSVLDRVRLLRALAPFPLATRLLVVTLAQIHALRLLATESRDGLRSRLPRRPGALDVLRNASGLTATLFTLSLRNARDVSDAMRSRGF